MSLVNIPHTISLSPPAWAGCFTVWSCLLAPYFDYCNRIMHRTLDWSQQAGHFFCFSMANCWCSMIHRWCFFWTLLTTTCAYVAVGHSRQSCERWHPAYQSWTKFAFHHSCLMQRSTIWFVTFLFSASPQKNKDGKILEMIELLFLLPTYRTFIHPSSVTMLWLSWEHRVWGWGIHPGWGCQSISRHNHIHT